MLYKYRGLIVTVILVLIVSYIGARDAKKTTSNSVKVATQETTLDHSAQAQSAPGANITKDDKAISNENIALTPSQVEEIVKNYVLNNPQIITEALDKLQQQKMEEMQKSVEKEIVANERDLTAAANSLFLGNPNGSSIIVMFYDYNCGYCKQSANALKDLMNDNNDVKLVLKPYPILGESSEELAKICQALFHESPEKFKVIHEELLSNKLFTKEDLKALFVEHKLNFDKIEELAKSTAVNEAIKNNFDLANKLKINGVPAFIINGKYYPGYLSVQQLKEKIAVKSTSATPNTDTIAPTEQEAATGTEPTTTNEISIPTDSVAPTKPAADNKN